MRRTAAFTALWKALRGQRRPGGPSVGEQFAAAPRMVRATLSGRYPHLPKSRLALMALAVAYIVSPVDLVPEAALLLVGLGDDAMVLAWLSGALLSETQAFVEWERTEGAGRKEHSERVVPGEVL
ncbi:MAG TPA: DUF1232 domain-containing protein [Actinomycetales bacterium]|nr:DUF1232 domain-containing protein [Actinomycetales bacterium]